MRTLKIAAVSSLIAASSAMAGGPAAANNDTQFGVGFAYKMDGIPGLVSVATPSLSVDAIFSNLEAGVSTSIVNTKTGDADSVTAYGVGGYFGMRQSLGQAFYGSLGVSGDIAFSSVSGEPNPYVVGAYAGLNFKPGNNFQIFARLMPYAYSSNDQTGVTRARGHQFFSTGSVGINYFFS